MSRGRPAAGGGRWIEVGPERIERWLAGFAERHGPVEITEGPELVRYMAADGAVAECQVPFPPLSGPLAEHAQAVRRVGVLLVRLGGYAAGVFDGDELIVAKAGSRPVHGRSAAGGWSQQRFARRRDKQARQALEAAADVAVAILEPYREGLAGLVLGGDRRAVEELREDRRLGPLLALAVPPFLTVPDPKRAVLQQTPKAFRAVRIRLVEP